MRFTRVAGNEQDLATARDALVLFGSNLGRLTVMCPACEATYFAQQATPPAPRAKHARQQYFAQVERTARAVLARTCPYHPDAFEV